MMSPLDQRATAYDPFGEPMAGSGACADAKGLRGVGTYRETRRAALVFWALALLFVGGRIYLSDQAPAHAAVAEAGSASAQVTSLR